MSDYIDREQAIGMVDDVPFIKEHPNIGLLWKTWLEDLPSAQPEIIRCKDCKHYQGEDSWLHCNRVTWFNGEDDFCSRAERKDNETD